MTEPKKVSLECYVWWPYGNHDPYLVKDTASHSINETEFLLAPLLRKFAQGQKVEITVEEIE